jgi:cytidylate kinase
MQGERIIITVDGVGASGKSALARLLAERLGYAHLNSGLLYRATAWLVSVYGVEPTSNDAVGHLLEQHSISLQYSRDKGTQVSVDGVIKEHELTTQENTQLASLVAKLPSVRDHFKPIQRHAFSPMSVVAEGAIWELLYSQMRRLNFLLRRI